MSDQGRGSDIGERTIFQPAQARPEDKRAAGQIGATPNRPALDDDLPDAPERTGQRYAMMEAAAPLLALVAAMRFGRIDIDLPALHRKASASAARFDAALVGAGYDEETRRRARYAVFATVDDIAQNLPGRVKDSAEWARRSMVVRGFGENIGGDRFWQLLSQMLSRPADYLELIELYHACLAVGFEGRHRVGDSGGQLRNTLRSAYAALPQIRTLSDVELVPEWRGTPTPRGRIGFWTPLALRLVLIQTGQPSMQAMRAINPENPLRLSRAAVPPPPQASAQAQRVEQFLADEIARKLVVVDRDANSLHVRTTIGALFRSGSDELVPGRAAPVSYTHLTLPTIYSV